MDVTNSTQANLQNNYSNQQFRNSFGTVDYCITASRKEIPNKIIKSKSG